MDAMMDAMMDHNDDMGGDGQQGNHISGPIAVPQLVRRACNPQPCLMQNQSAHRLLDSPFAPPARACGPVAASPANARRGLARLISERAELDFPSPRIVSLGLRPRAIGGRGKVDHENHPGAHAHSPTMLRVRKEAYHGLRLSVGAEASPRVLDKPVYEKSLDESRTKPLTSEPLCTAHRESGTVEPALAKRAKETECQSARVPESQKSQSAKVPKCQSAKSAWLVLAQAVCTVCM